MSKKSLTFLIVLALMLVPVGAFADSISPSSVTIFGDPTNVVIQKIHKVVTIDKGLPTTAKADIFFLSDTTGSMGPFIANVKASASALLTNTAALGDVAWGAGEYKDVGDPFTAKINQNITKVQADVQTGINAWAASGGGDAPEANLFGLNLVATTGAWRSGSQRLIVQFGDAPGHDPSNGVTEADATNAMLAQGIKLLAVNVGNKDATGQETRMTAATGGELTTETDPAKLTDAIQALIAKSFATYHTVSLDLSGLPVGVAALAIPTEYTGDFTREETRTFEFDLVIAACCQALGGKNVSFDINALVDGAVVATEHDKVICTPLPGTLLLLGSGMLGFVGLRRRFV